MEDSSTQDLRDYKFFSFNGVTKALFVATDHQTEGEETKFDFFDMTFRHLNIRNGHDNADVPPAKPERFEEMKHYADLLSENVPQLRMDFYEVNGQTCFGELTFVHWDGMMPFEPEKWDYTFGSWIKLPEINGGGYTLIGSGYTLWLHQREDRQHKSLNDLSANHPILRVDFYELDGSVLFSYSNSFPIIA